MDPDRLRTLDAPFAAALDLPPRDRPAFLDAACPDPALRAEVERLLAAHDRADPYFEELVERVAASAPLEVEVASREQAVIGAYRTLKIIGRGGMSTVFLAERADGQFTQRVALKLIAFGMDTDTAVRRFLAQRQIVARLDHPNIARLLDGGVTGHGRPYFVMELVEGGTITAYCDRERLPIEARLRLFLEVADALQYAHGLLVVHRDVKPGNVMVTREGRVKLLDFGIAKLLAPERAEGASDLTRTRERALTPGYAAPEQIRGDPATTAVDVYALGVLLYELLTGRRPIEPDGMPDAAFEQRVLEEVPARPSEIPITAAAADARAMRPDRLRRALDGDLDVICLTALRKEPERRYRSVEQLAGDVRRHLDGLPIAARDDTLRYRAGKFVRRHRASVATAAALFLVSVGFSAVLAVQSVRLARERDKAQHVASLFVDLFQVADPSESRGQTVTAREVLDRGVERIRSGLGSQPEVRGALLEVIGRVYQNLGLYQRARPLLEEALAARRVTLGPEHRDVATAMGELGELLRLSGEYGAAEQMLRESLAQARRLGGTTTAAAARTMNHLAKVLLATGKLDEAERVSRDALQIATRVLGAGHEEVAESLNTIAAVRFTKGDDTTAEPLFRQALDIRRRRLGRDHPLVPAALNNLASLLSRRGDHAAAVASYREALDIYRQLFGAEHPRVATTMNNLGVTYYSSSDHLAAEPLLRESLALRRRLLPAGHPDIAQSASNLGLLLQTTGRLAEAEPLYREVLDVRRRSVGQAHPLFGQSLHNLALLRQAQGEMAEAGQLFARALDVLSRALGAEHPLVALSHHSLGGHFEATGDRRRAARHYREALAIRTKLLPAGHPDRVATESRLAALAQADRPPQP
jgi:serine/threonine-protein kinase